MSGSNEPTAEAQQQTQARYEQQQKAIEQRAGEIQHIILVMSGKGGVGKSTVAVNLAWALALGGESVGLLDADLHGPNTALMTGTQDTRLGMRNNLMQPAIAAHGLKVISMAMLLDDRDTPTIWRGPLRANVLRQFIAEVEWGQLDYLIVDLPPGTGDEPLTIAQAFPDADGVIIVTTPQQVSQDDCRKAINFARKLELAVIGVIENMSGFVCPHCGKETAIFSQGGGETMASEMGVPFLGTLPLVPEVVTMCDSGRPLTDQQAPQAIRDAFAVVVGAVNDHLAEQEN